MNKKKIIKLVEFITKQYKEVKESINPNKSDYHEQCSIICLLQHETLKHVLYCIEKGVNLKKYKKNNIGTKKNWFGIE